MVEHCPQPGLPARQDFVIVAEALSQVSQELSIDNFRRQLKTFMFAQY